MVDFSQGGDLRMADTKVGKVTHYYDKLEVAVLELSGALVVGDKIKIVGRAGEFTQEVDSMQMEHEKVNKAKKGDTVGLKVSQKVKDGDQVFRVKG
jgi:putative protease